MSEWWNIWFHWCMLTGCEIKACQLSRLMGTSISTQSLSFPFKMLIMHELDIFELGKMQLCSLCWESVMTCHIFLRWVSKFVIISRNVKQTLFVLCLQVQGTPWLRLWGCWKSTGSNPNILSYSASSPHLMVSQTAQHKCSRHQLGFVYLPDHTLCPLLLLHSCFCCISVYIKNTVANNNEVLWRCWSEVLLSSHQ